MTMQDSFSNRLSPFQVAQDNYSRFELRFSTLLILLTIFFFGLSGCYTQFVAPSETSVKRQRIIIPRSAPSSTDSITLDPNESFEAGAMQDAIIIENDFTPNYSRFFSPGFGWQSPYGFNSFYDPFINPWASPSIGFAGIWNNPWGIWNPYWGIGGANWNGLWGFPIAAAPWGWNWWGIPRPIPYNSESPSYAGYGINRRMMGRMRSSMVSVPQSSPVGSFNSQNLLSPSSENNLVPPAPVNYGITNRRTNGSTNQSGTNGVLNNGVNSVPLGQSSTTTGTSTTISRPQNRRANPRNYAIPQENYRPQASPVPRNTYTPPVNSGRSSPTGTNGNSGTTRSGNSSGSRSSGRGRN
ncbi:MAG: hypothetical protein SFU91_08630 [Chloroherpetonaceae bacterium]|nr:hypothetical protein [Chloroherpetonaceae bacterium]